MKQILSVIVVVILSVFLGNIVLTPIGDFIDEEATLIEENGVYKDRVERFVDGTYMVAVRTSMPGTSADMVRWWFSDYLQTTEHYKMWHPTAHVWMDWENKKPGEIVGASHLVHEYLGESLFKLRIQFVDPTEIFGYNPNTKNRFVICARTGDLESPVNLGRMCHIVVNTPDGAEMRSRFWLGHIAAREGNSEVPSLVGFLGNTLLSRYIGLNERGALDLMIHAQEEMSTLGKLLPTIYPEKQ